MNNKTLKDSVVILRTSTELKEQIAKYAKLTNTKPSKVVHSILENNIAQMRDILNKL